MKLVKLMEGYYGKKEMETLNETLQISTRELPVKKDQNKNWGVRLPIVDKILREH